MNGLGDEWYRGAIPSNANTVIGKIAVERGFDITGEDFQELLEDMEAYVGKRKMLVDLKSRPANARMRKFKSAILGQWWDSLSDTRLHSSTVPDAFKRQAKERFWLAFLDRCRPRSRRDNMVKVEVGSVRLPAGHQLQPPVRTQVPIATHTDLTATRTAYRPRPPLDDPLPTPLSLAEASFTIYAENGSRLFSFLLTEAIKPELEHRLDDPLFHLTLRMISFDRLVQILRQEKNVRFRPDKQVLEARVSESEITNDIGLRSAILSSINVHNQASVDIALLSAPEFVKGAREPRHISIDSDSGTVRSASKFVERAREPRHIPIQSDSRTDDEENATVSDEATVQPEPIDIAVPSESEFVEEGDAAPPDEATVQPEPTDIAVPLESNFVEEEDAAAPDKAIIQPEPRNVAVLSESIFDKDDDATIQSGPRSGHSPITLEPDDLAIGLESRGDDERAGARVDHTGGPHQQRRNLRKRTMESNPFLTPRRDSLHPSPVFERLRPQQTTDAREAKKRKVGVTTSTSSVCGTRLRTPAVIWRDSDASMVDTRASSASGSTERITRRKTAFIFTDEKLIARDKRIQAQDEDDEQLEAEEDGSNIVPRAKKQAMSEEEREAKALKEEERRRRLEEAAAFGEMYSTPVTSGGALC